MKKKKRDRLNFGLGLTAGLVVGYYLASDEGRDLLQRLRLRLEDLSEELGKRVQEQIDQFEEGFDTAFSTSNNPDEEGQVGDENDLTPGPRGLIVEARQSFLRGMEKARRRIREEKENGLHPDE